MQSAALFAGTEDTCDRTSRITDEQAIELAKADLKRRSPNYNPSLDDFSVTEKSCHLYVLVAAKVHAGLGGSAVLVLTRSGEVKYYFGGM